MFCLFVLFFNLYYFVQCFVASFILLPELSFKLHFDSSSSYSGRFPDPTSCPLRPLLQSAHVLWLLWRDAVGLI